MQSNSHLKDTYGFNDFRPMQKDVIDTILSGKDVITIFPTGGGKSLCYQFPATSTGKLSIVISPLISLMTDQGLFLEHAGISSLVLNSQTYDESMEMEIDDKLEVCNIVYCTPEFLLNHGSEIFSFYLNRICMIAIDEAHCVSEWGHDFRPSYRKLNNLKTLFPNIPIAAFTATATPSVINDIKKVLAITNESGKTFIKSVRRPNLCLSVHHKSDIKSDLVDIIDPEASTIIYCQTCKKCDEVYKVLCDNGLDKSKIGIYHGKISSDTRNNVHKDFVGDKIKLIIATIAFGMGIDKPDIRHVINYGAPSNLETYYQEVGRAGRDGAPSHATLFYQKGDFAVNRLLASSSSNKEQRSLMLNMFEQYLSNTSICRQQMLGYYFKTGDIKSVSQSESKSCGICDNCVGINTNSTNKVGYSQDLTKEVNLVLRLINSLSHNLGITKLVNILLGKGSNMEKFKHLSQWGAGAYHNGDWWKSLVELIVTEKFLEKILFRSKFNLLAITSKGVHAIGDEHIMSVNYDMMLTEINKDVFDRLKQIRSALSKEKSIAPFMIVSDIVLIGIAKAKPKTLDELKNIDGISELFLTKYGEKFLSPKTIKIRVPGKSQSQSQSTYDSKEPNSSALESYSLFSCGKSISEIAAIRKLSQISIQNHICMVFEHDLSKINYQQIGLTSDIYEMIQKAIEKVGPTKLKPIKDLLPNDVSYFQIKVSMLSKN